MRKLPEKGVIALAPTSCLALLLSGVLSHGCAGTPEPPPTSGPNASAAVVAPSASATAVVSASASAATSSGGAPNGSASSAPSASASSVALPAPKAGPLALFHAALGALKKGERSDHVRVMWLGDSHAQADFWPHAIRLGLQTRFGVGGPGFLRIGFKQYRSSSAAVKVDGSWRMRPKRPSTIKPWGDGSFGLGGILHAGYAGQRRARLRLNDDRLAGRKLTIELCYKHGLPNDVFRWSVSGRADETIRASGEADVGQIRYLKAQAQGLARIQVTPLGGRPDFCGVTVETDPKNGAGVVLDNLGINGARYGTALAWNEQAWAAAVKRHPAPELFIFEYGGNEASDLVSTPELYKRNALALIARARRIRADASCLVIAPSDRADAEDRIFPIVTALEQAAAEAGCAFWNTYQKMGGKGSLRTWRAQGKASPDGVHLKQNGYATLGQWLLRDLLADMPK